MISCRSLPIVFFITIIAASCGNSDYGSVEIRPRFGSIQSPLEGRLTIPTSVTKLRLTVTGDGMSDISVEQDVEDEGAIRVGGIPAGNNRTVVLECLESDGFVSYHGSTTVSIQSGKTTTVLLDLVSSPKPPQENGVDLDAIEINGDADLTNDHVVTVTLRCTNASEFSLAVGKNATERDWQAFTDADGDDEIQLQYSIINGHDTGSPGPLPGERDGRHYVSVIFRDEHGFTSRQSNDDIELDTTDPGIMPLSASIQLSPAEGNVVPDAVKITDGTIAYLSFTVTEFLSDNPIVSTTTPEVLTFDFVSASGITYLYKHEFSGLNHAQGGYVVSANLTDMAGNTIDVPIELPSPGFVVDTDAPDAPDTFTVGKVVYRRIPWGSKETDLGSPRSSLILNSTAFEIPCTIIVFKDSPYTVIKTEKIAEEVYPIELDLGASDTSLINIRIADEAGNLSDSSEVKDIEWIATMGYKETGSDFNNPHQYLSRKRFAPYLYQEGESGVTERGFADGMSSMGGSASDTVGMGYWQNLTAASFPEERAFHSLAYDNSRGEIVLFGGEDNSLANCEGRGTRHCRNTWIWDGRWQIASEVGPIGRDDAGMAYSQRRGDVVLFGGYNWDESCGEGWVDNYRYCAYTWSWDGNSWHVVSETGPNPRRYLAMVENAVNGSILMFGGYIAGGCDEGTGSLCGYTWELKDDTWEVVSTTGPPPRECHAMAYDYSRDRVVLFGGYDSQALNDTWEWDGDSWHLVSTTGPSPRCGPVMTYDQSRGTVLLFGGGDSGGGDSNETWEWDGVNWQLITSSGPAGRNSSGLVSNGITGNLFLFGGYDSGAIFDDTWVWTGNEWKEVLYNIPPQHHYHAMETDWSNNKILMYGEVSDDTWIWDGYSWTSSSVPGPTARENADLAYDHNRQKVVMFGGYEVSTGNFLNETWEWDVSGWQLVSVGGPDPRDRHAIAYHPLNAGVVLFGGYNSATGTMYGDTWVWNSGTWSHSTDAGPSSRCQHAMAYDSAREKVVLFGGTDLGEQTWEWDGSSWSLVSSTGPEDRVRHASSYDPERGKTIIFGGRNSGDCLEGGDNLCRYVWEWDGTTWNQASSDGPRPRDYPAMAYDSYNQRTIMFSGSTDSQTWSWNGGGTERPGQSISVNFHSAGQYSSLEIREISTVWHAGGAGYPGGQSQFGTILKVWDRGGWIDIENNDAGPADLSDTSLSELTWSTTDSDQINRILVGDKKSINFAVTPSAPNGFGGNGDLYGKVSVDYAEVAVKYRLP